MPPMWEEKIEEMIRHDLGERIMSAIADPDIEEVRVNADGGVHIVSASKGTQPVSPRLDPRNVETFMRAVATLSGSTIGPDVPWLAATLPHTLGKCRLQGFLPPVTVGPAFVLRKPPGRLIPLDEYVTQGVLSPKGKAVICELVAQRKNIIVAGATASGKTTLCNAILAEVLAQFPGERLLVLEDTRELHIEHTDYLRLQTTATLSMRHLVQHALRSSPHRIVVGEVRDEAARDLLDAWITGHPGGCGTVHGEDCERALERLAGLAQEASPGIDQRRIVAQAVHSVVLIRGHGHARRVTAIAHLLGQTSAGWQLEYEDL